MTKKEMAQSIARDMNESHVLVQEIIQRFLDGIIDALEKERRFELRNFGVFTVEQRSAKMARNWRTSEAMMVPAKLVAHFEPGLEMQKRIGKLQILPNDDE